MKKALFLDRDGTINVDKGYVYKIEDFILIDGICDMIKRFMQSGYLIIVVTNQSGVGRGYFSEEDVQILHRYADSILALQGVKVDKWYYCPHHPSCGMGAYKLDCNCRKPKTGMIEKAVKEFDIDVSQSLLVGDREEDIMCGERMGMKSIYVTEFLKLSNV